MKMKYTKSMEHEKSRLTVEKDPISQHDKLILNFYGGRVETVLTINLFAQQKLFFDIVLEMKAR